MIITNVNINRFRGFQNQEFMLGSQLTAIAGQNGTQKSTLLGIITQTFTLSSTNPMGGEKPLCGGSYRSAFSEKFRLSRTFDQPGQHEWTLSFDNREDFTIESIKRSGSANVRFWQKGKKGKGDGYLQFPTIFLSMKRVLPLAENKNIKTSVVLTSEEESIFKDLHKKILLNTRDNIRETITLSSPNKQTIGITTDKYDWNQNSLGQDNIGKIILALISFRRLKNKYRNHYHGGILAIDELDATMYPASQRKLLEILYSYAARLKIQIVFTTHSLSLLSEMNKICLECEKTPARLNQAKIVFLKREDDRIKIYTDESYDLIRLNLNVETAVDKSMRKITVYAEDKENITIAKAILGKKRCKYLNFIDVTMPCSELIELSHKKIPAFTHPFSIIILDGDVRGEREYMRKIGKCNNILILPGDKSPERMIADYLNPLSDSDAFWSKCCEGYSQQYCFSMVTYEEVMAAGELGRQKAKEWFNLQLQSWGHNASKVVRAMKAANKRPYEDFLTEFDEMINKY